MKDALVAAAARPAWVLCHSSYCTSKVRADGKVEAFVGVSVDLFLL
jgi:hypothetical protein